MSLSAGRLLHSGGNTGLDQSWQLLEEEDRIALYYCAKICCREHGINILDWERKDHGDPPTRLVDLTGAPNRTLPRQRR